MFTGIITHLGKVIAKTDNKLLIKSDIDLVNKLSNGVSVAVNGICLTVVSINKNIFAIDFMPETASRTTIQYLANNDLVNLELPATPNTFLSGHIVQGHIDGIGKIKSIEKNKNSWIFIITLPEKLNRYIVEKGSIAINGISLTVIDVADKYFTVGIIPHTFKNTMLCKTKAGDYVNIELDILAKYLEKLVTK